MSDLPPELLRPPAPLTWRERWGSLAESLDLSPVRLAVGIALVAALVAGGWHFLDAPPPPVEMQLPMTTTPRSSTSSPTSSPASSSAAGSTASTAGAGDGAGELVVHVAGAVAGPGVQRLPTGTRVVDAIDAAGGASPDADIGRINLAAPLEDGQQVYVPKVGEPLAGGGQTAGVGGAGGAGGTADQPPVVALNTATVDELDVLPGVGPSIAQAIVDHRTTHGPFGSVEELLDVRGIGQAKLDEIRPRVTL